MSETTSNESRSRSRPKFCEVLKYERRWIHLRGRLANSKPDDVMNLVSKILKDKSKKEKIRGRLVGKEGLVGELEKSISIDTRGLFSVWCQTKRCDEKQRRHVVEKITDAIIDQMTETERVQEIVNAAGVLRDAADEMRKKNGSLKNIDDVVVLEEFESEVTKEKITNEEVEKARNQLLQLNIVENDLPGNYKEKLIEILQLPDFQWEQVIACAACFGTKETSRQQDLDEKETSQQQDLDEIIREVSKRLTPVDILRCALREDIYEEEDMNANGLCLSGGGIRSATFNLGLLQAFHRRDLLKEIDYLSTVSGGGYIGASLIWFKLNRWKRFIPYRRNQKTGRNEETKNLTLREHSFPFGVKRKDARKFGGKVLHWLRINGNYLTPGDGVNMWTLVGAIVTGSLVNLLIVIPFFLLVFIFLSIKIFDKVWPSWLYDEALLIHVFLIFGSLLFIYLFIFIIVFAIGTGSVDPKLRMRLYSRKRREQVGKFLMLAFLFTAIGLIPTIDQKVSDIFADSSHKSASNEATTMLEKADTVSSLKYKKARVTEQTNSSKTDGQVVYGKNTLADNNEQPLKLADQVVAILAGVMSILIAIRGRTLENETKGLRPLLLYVGLSVLLFGVALLLFDVAQYLVRQPHILLSILAAIGIVTLLLLMTDSFGKTKLSRNIRAAITRVSLLVALVLVVVGLYYAPLVTLAASAMALSVFLLVLVDINHISMHRYYRNRLTEAYMPHRVPAAEQHDEDGTQQDHDEVISDELDPDLLHLEEVPITDAPYPIINTTLQTVRSEKVKLRERGGESFILSPLYCGSENTNYVKTDEYAGGPLTLGTAMAISGAAVNPNSYATRSRPLSFLMTLLNIRLGYWVRNPSHMGRRCARTGEDGPTILDRKKSQLIGIWGRIKSYLSNMLLENGQNALRVREYHQRNVWDRMKVFPYMFMDMLHGLSEKDEQIVLSDGGHFDNLGLYELIRRRCHLIIVSDAGADPNWTFADLAKAIELARVDFGARINIDVRPIKPKGEDKISDSAFVFGTIIYEEENCNGKDKSTSNKSRSENKGYLVYIKTAVIKGLQEDIYGYQRANRKFPDQSTMDQFFDEPEFEAYRELGYQIGDRLCKACDPRDVGAFIDDMLSHRNLNPNEKAHA